MGTDHPEADEQRRAAIGELEHELSLLFRRARGLSTRIAAQIHPELDAAGYGLLVAILDLDPDGDGVRAVDLAHKTRLHKSTLSRSLGVLEGLGLLKRVRDPHDARARLVTLTEQGRAAVQASRTGRSELILRRLSEWDVADLSRLAELLGRLSRALTVDP